MKLERTKNTARNLKYGVILKMVSIVLPFVMRTVILWELGVEYLGLGGLFASIIQTLNLAELGVNSAMVFSMYRAIAEDDEDTICALMKLYRYYYRIIGGVILGVGLLLLPFLRNLVAGDLPGDVNMYVLYLLELGTTVFTYWLFSYKNSLLSAFQRQDVSSKINLIVALVRSAMQVMVLYVFHNYYAYLSIALAMQVATNIITAIVVSKMYPNYEPRGEVSPESKKKIKERIRDLFFAKIAGTIVTTSDTLVISAFLGLRMLAIYQNYYYIMNSIVGVLLIASASSMAGIGNSLLTESKEKNYHDFRKLSFMMLWIITVCTCCLLCMYQSFMKIWAGENNLFGVDVMILFCVYFFVYMNQRIGIIYKDASGIWRDDRNRTLITALTNLILNLAFVQQFGIYAITLSTIVSYLVVGTPWLIRNLFKLVFCMSSREYVKSLFVHVAVTLICAGACFGVCLVTEKYLSVSNAVALLMYGAISLLLSNGILFIFYRKSEMFPEALAFGKRLLKRK